MVTCWFPACSLEHEILSFQAAGLWYSTWCLTGALTVSVLSLFFLGGGGVFTHTHTHTHTHTCKDGEEFCKVRHAHSHHHRDCVHAAEEVSCVFALSTPRNTFCQTVGAAPLPPPPPPRARAAVPVTSRSSGSGGDSPGNLSRHSSQLLLSHLLGPPLSWRFVLPPPFSWNISQQHQTCQWRGFQEPTLPPLPPSDLFPSSPSASFPRILPSSCTACVSSFCSNERQGSARQTPGVWQSYLLCLHVSSSTAHSFSLSLSLSLSPAPPSHAPCLSRSPSLNTRAVDYWQFDAKLFPRVGSSCHDGE